MRASFKASADADVATLRMGLDQYRNTQERLEMQKKLLLHQARTMHVHCNPCVMFR